MRRMIRIVAAAGLTLGLLFGVAGLAAAQENEDRKGKITLELLDTQVVGGPKGIAGSGIGADGLSPNGG